MAFKHKPNKFLTGAYQSEPTSIFTKEVDKNGIKEVVQFRHVCDSSVLPSLPDPEIFNSEHSLASGRNLNELSSKVLTPDSFEADSLANNIINDLDE